MAMHWTASAGAFWYFFRIKLFYFCCALMDALAATDRRR
ncbi:hypothetical protein D3OALGB2SA_3158 [Olavius algarvensis associated proteobacterium Delta 3]|nr:hypothetical protein D3OALGB2SA_3158 [Olavius algarvensis associated proteobacterium Delta 3]